MFGTGLVSTIFNKAWFPRKVIPQKGEVTVLSSPRFELQAKNCEKQKELFSCLKSLKMFPKMKIPSEFPKADFPVRLIVFIKSTTLVA